MPKLEYIIPTAPKLYCLLIFVLAIGDLALGQDCNALIHYRDVELLEQYDQAFFKYRISQDALNDIRQIRQETLDEREWNKVMSTGVAITDGGLLTALIAKNIKATCSLISDLLKINPAAGMAGTVIEKTSLTAENIYKSLELGKTIGDVVDEGVEKTAYKELLSKGGPLGQAVKAAWSYSEEVAQMVSMPEDRDKLKSEVKRILEMIDNAVVKYQHEIAYSKARITELNNIKTGIDKYLHTYCLNAAKDKDLPIVKKEPVKDNSRMPAASVVKEKKAVGNAFYIFLTAELYANKKHLTLISAPILHNGMLTDDMSSYKAEFIDQIQKQLPGKPDDFRQRLEQNNYNIISVHYAKPYSTSLLKSVSESLDAIEAYKQSIRHAVEGLSNADLIDFFQLN